MRLFFVLLFCLEAFNLSGQSNARYVTVHEGDTLSGLYDEQ
jgi:hypothetical protein